MPAASVSQNSARRYQTKGEILEVPLPAGPAPAGPAPAGPAPAGPVLLADIWHESHEPRSFDRFRYGMLARRGATRLPSADDPSMAIDQLGQQFQVLVIHVHGAGTLAIHQQGIPLLHLRFDPRSLTREFLACWCPSRGIR